MVKKDLLGLYCPYKNSGWISHLFGSGVSRKPYESLGLFVVTNFETTAYVEQKHLFFIFFNAVTMWTPTSIGDFVCMFGGTKIASYWG